MKDVSKKHAAHHREWFQKVGSDDSAALYEEEEIKRTEFQHG